MYNRRIVLGGREITYELTRKRIKNINLRIKPNGKVMLSAPAGVSMATLEKFLISKTDFILSALDRFSGRQHPVMQYKTGDVYRILGRDKTLYVYNGSRNSVTQDDKHVFACVRNHTDAAYVKRVLDAWEREMLEEYLDILCRKVYRFFRDRGVIYPEIKIRKMTARWGSCQPENHVLTFNTALIAAPLSCIEYVIMHEFVHFLVPNHSPAFYEQLTALMPDWKERKNILEENKRS